MSTDGLDLHSRALEVDEEPKTPAPALQRQDSSQRSIKGILKKSRSTGLEAEPPEPERITTPVTKTSKEPTFVDGKEEDKEDEEEEYKEGRRLQREENSSSETPRTPSPDSLSKTPSISQSEEGEESESSLDGSKERYDGSL